MTHEEMVDEAQRRESENENIDGGESVPQGSSPNEGGEHMDDESKTQRAFDENAKGFNDRWAGNSTYIEIPDSVVLDDYVADWTEVHDWIDRSPNICRTR